MTSPIRDVLKTLHQNSELVEQAVAGIIEPESGPQTNSVSALLQASALRPAGEDGYRLHQKLREYLQDHLQLFPAFQSLAEIGSRISQVNSLWIEIDQIRRLSDQETINTLIETIQTVVFDIGDSMDRNMLLLQTLMSTRYGNVKSLEAKKSQNRYYQQQTHTLADDLVRLARVCDKVEREASQRSMEELARFIRRNLLARVMDWQQGMAEMQTLIRKEIFRMHAVERDLRMLARMDMLLRQQPAWRGFEVDLQGQVPDFLMAASLPAMVSNVEPMDTDRGMLEEMKKLAESLPPKAVEPAPSEPPKRYTRIVDPPRVLEVTPGVRAMKQLVRDITTTDAVISLVAWRKGNTDALTMEPNVWLIFAVMALRGRKILVELVSDIPRVNERFSHTFTDATVKPKPVPNAYAPA